MTAGVRRQAIRGALALVALTPACSTVVGADFSNKVLCTTDCPGTPTLLATDQGVPAGLSTDQQNVYWINNRVSIMKCALGGCQQSPIALVAGQTGIVAMALDASNVYWVTDGSDVPGGEVMKCAISGCRTPTVIFSPGMTDAEEPPNPTAIATDGTRVYWASGPQILACPITGACTTPTAIVSEQNPVAIAVDATSTNIYWGNSDANGTVMRCAIGQCGSPTLLASGRGQLVDIALHGTNIYWATRDSLFECGAGGCNGSPTVLAGGVSPFGLAVDDTGVYWADGLNIRTCALGGCNNMPTQVVTSSGATSVALSATQVYFADSDEVSTFPK